MNKFACLIKDNGAELRMGMARQYLDKKRRVNHMADTKPNILVIWGDDIGITNLSC